MRLLFCVCLVLLAPGAFASPFLACDPAEGVTDYEITASTTASFPTVLAAEPDGSLRMDCAGAPVGDTYIQVKACSFWGCSPPADFVISRPSAHSAPRAFKLVK